MVERHRGLVGHGAPIVGRNDLQELIGAVVDGLVGAGIERANIRTRELIDLPGTYRSAMVWDLLLLDEGIPVGAIDFVSQVGSSFGRNYNNRISDMVAVAADFNRAYARDPVSAYKPCLGKVFVLEECEESIKLLRRSARAGFLAADAPLAALSIRDRYLEVFRRLLGDRMYDAIWYVTTRRPPEFSINEPDPAMGFTSFVRAVTDRVAAIQQVRRGAGVDAVAFGRMLAQRDDVDELMSGLTSIPAGLSAAESARIRRRRQTVATLRDLAMADDTNESKMHTAIGKCYWLFGGQYVDVMQRRNLVPLDEYDIPLICADGSLHIVELKGPKSRLIQRHRGHLITANEVHEAVSQCLNYLRSLDEMGGPLRTLHRNELGLDYDYRRARGTVVIGHPDRQSLRDVTREQIDQTIRSYNAALSRVQVVTWADLLDSADRALKFEADDQTVQRET